jgi:hypothetical protein
VRNRLAHLFWFGGALSVCGLLAYYVQRTPIVFLLDMRWPSFMFSLAIGVAGLALCGVGVYGRGTRLRAIVVLITTGAIAFMAITNLSVYREMPVTFTSDDAELSGTLLIPRGAGPHPAVIVVHGTAPNARAPYRGIAELLVRHGIAALTYDKRGFAASKGPLPYRYDDLAGDVLSAAARLKGLDEIDGSRIGLIGFSEGGFVAPLAASRSSDIAFMAVVSGAGASPARTVNYEMKTRLRDDGFAETVVNEALQVREGLHEYYRTRENADAVLESIDAVKEEPWFTPAFEIRAKDVPDSLDDIQYTADYPADLDFDPLAHLARLEIPMLFLFGEADVKVPPQESAEAIRNTLIAAEREHFEIKTFPDADHLIMINYEPAPGYLDTLTNWFVQHASVSG